MGGIELTALIAAVCVAAFACIVAAYAVFRTLIPPQQRQVNELRARVEDVEDDNDRIHGRLTERSARDNMQKARDTKAVKGELEARARELLQQQGKGSPPAVEAGPATAADVEAQRAALRRRFLS